MKKALTIGALAAALGVFACSSIPTPQMPDPAGAYCDEIVLENGNYVGLVEEKFVKYTVFNDQCKLYSTFKGHEGTIIDHDCDNVFDLLYLNEFETFFYREDVSDSGLGFFTQVYFDGMLNKGQWLACEKNKDN